MIPKKNILCKKICNFSTCSNSRSEKNFQNLFSDLKSAWSNWSRRIKVRFNIEKIKKVKFIAIIFPGFK
jgi:hypothetical protein